MIPSAQHPSFLALDAYALEDQAAVGVHVASCPQCQRHVDAVQALDAVPEWVRSLPRARRPFTRWFAIFGGGGALVAAMVAAFLIWAPPSSPPVADGGLRAKGMGPTVIVHVKRDGKVSQWRTGQRLRTGDILRLEISPDGFRHVRVTSPTSSGESVLFSGTLEPRKPTLLPLGLQIDATARTEQLRVILDDLVNTPEGSSPRTWEKTLTFDLEGAP